MAVLSYQEKGTGDFPVIDDGVYPAQITDVQVTESTLFTDKEGKPKEQLQVDFTVAADDADQDDDVRIRAWAGLSFTPKSKLTPWIKAVLGVDPSEGVQVDTDDLFEKRCQIVVGHKTGTDGITRNTIQNVLPPKKRRRPADEAKEDLPF